MKVAPDTISKPLAVFVFGWFAAVVAQGLLAGQGWTLLPVDFELSGKFGDSFGALASVMAAAAAIGAWQAVSDQRKALEQAKEREDELREVAAKRDFEATYFNLLATLDRIVIHMDVGRWLWLRTGKDAFSYFVEELHKKRSRQDRDFRGAYERVFDEYRNDLAHYFRMLFNIVRFVKISRPDDGR